MGSISSKSKEIQQYPINTSDLLIILEKAFNKFDKYRYFINKGQSNYIDSYIVSKPNPDIYLLIENHDLCIYCKNSVLTADKWKFTEATLIIHEVCNSSITSLFFHKSCIGPLHNQIELSKYRKCIETFIMIYNRNRIDYIVGSKFDTEIIRYICNFLINYIHRFR